MSKKIWQWMLSEKPPWLQLFITIFSSVLAAVFINLTYLIAHHYYSMFMILSCTFIALTCNKRLAFVSTITLILWGDYEFIGPRGQILNTIFSWETLIVTTLTGAVVIMIVDYLRYMIKCCNLYETELKQALVARETFIGIASHELKTPLTTLLLLIGLSRQKIRENKMTIEFMNNKCLGEMESQTRNLIGLINEMMDMSKISTGQFRLRKTSSNLTNLIRDTIEKNFCVSHVKIELQENVIATVDPLRIEQVISNLVSNAIKYGQNKPIEVRLEASADYAWISVKDQGKGIAKEDLARLFQKFERIGAPESTTGLGLGLYITYQIITAHLGTIEVISKVNDGSKFTVKLPLR